LVKTLLVAASRFAPLEAQWQTNPLFHGAVTGQDVTQGTTFERFLRGNPGYLSPRSLLDRLAAIGKGPTDFQPERDFISTFTPALTRQYAELGATRNLNPGMRAARLRSMGRIFDKYQFENPGDSPIGDLAELFPALFSGGL